MLENLSIEIFGILLLILLLIILPEFKKLFILETYNSEIKAERNTAIDFTRGIAMISIVLIHIDSYFQFFHPNDFETYITRLIANFSRFCVPAFIFSSGFFLSYKGANPYWTSKLKSLFLPYLIISIIGYFTKYPPFEFFETIVKKIIMGQVFQPYYYVALLFQFYFLFAVFFKNYKSWSKTKFSLILFFSALINFWSNHYFPKPNEFVKSIEAISFTNYIFYFVLGLSAKTLLTNKMDFLNAIKPLRVKLILSISAFLYLIPVTYYTFKMKIEVSNHFLFYPIVSFVLITYLGLYFETRTNFLKKLYDVFCFIGENSLAIFLLHPMTIHLMHTFDPYSLGGKYISYFVTLAINIILPLLVWKFVYYFINKKEVSVSK